MSPALSHRGYIVWLELVLNEQIQIVITTKEVGVHMVDSYVKICVACTCICSVCTLVFYTIISSISRRLSHVSIN